MSALRSGLVVSGAQCRRRQWLELNAPRSSQPLRAWTANAARLRTAIHAVHTGRFGETFEADGVEVRVDYLEELDGGWGVRRFRAATRRKPWHLDELALQVHILRRCGLEIVSAELWRLDRSYRRGEELNVDEAVKRQEVLGQLSERIHDWVEVLPGLSSVPDEEPEVEPGPHCTRPRRCPFTSRCGVVPRQPKPSPLQDRIELARRTGKPVIDASLVEDLAAEGPVHALDFEAWAPALPAFRGTAPYEAIVIQWSIHTQHEGSLKHRAGLVGPDEDPRPILADALVEAFEEPGPIYVYSDFEAKALGRLAQALPHRTRALNALRSRLVDLLPLLREKFVHPDFEGSFGLKRVLPVLCPGEGYDDLDLGDGGEAALVYGELADAATSAARRAEIRQLLEVYCAKDSLALLHIRDALLELISP